MNTESLDIQDFYNDIAMEFADDWYANDGLLPTLKQFLALLPPSPKVLDLGCGAGYESMRLRRLGAAVTGVDFSEEPIRIAREKNPDIRFEIGDFRYLSPDLGRFDGIAAIASLIHIPDSELELVFTSMKSVLTENGFAMIIVVEGQGLDQKRSFVERNSKKYRRNFYLHDRERLKTAAIHNGIQFHAAFDLPEELAQCGWTCFIFQRTGES
jgi:SAM-dependent methyltransferase